MSSPDLPPLDPDLDALLDVERRRPPEAQAISARVLSRVLATVGPPGPGDGGSPAGPSPATAPGTGGAGAGASAAGSLLKPVVLGALLGGLASAGLVLAPDPGSPPSRSTPPPTATGRSTTPAPLDRAPPAPEPSAVRPASPAPAPSAAPRLVASAPEESLAAERLILDEAQRALADGRHGAALEALDRHAAAFPRGRLGEEREALSIRALARSGRMDEARARAARFREGHPRSILLPVVESAIGTIP